MKQNTQIGRLHIFYDAVEQGDGSICYLISTKRHNKNGDVIRREIDIFSDKWRAEQEYNRLTGEIA